MFRNRVLGPALTCLVLAGSGSAPREARAEEPPVALMPKSAEARLGMRHVQLDYTFEVEAPAGSKTLDVWFPVPQENAYQAVSDLKLTGPGVGLATAKDGNRMAHARIEGATGKLTFGASARIVRQERVNRSFRSRATALSTAEREAFEAELRPNRLIPLQGDRIDAFVAAELKDDPRDDTLLNKARRYYDVTLRCVEYKKEGEGWGKGDLMWVCDMKYGNCTDFHSLFLALCRRSGIPARFAIGVSIPKQRGEGKIGGYHCWAEFYAPGASWVPVDISEARKDLALREYYFGSHCEDRVELSVGRDVMLEPPQQAPPLNFFFGPHIEADGKSINGPKPAIAYKDLQ
jgi:hypothetical protein